MSLKVSLGVIKAVSNSSAENSKEIFKSGLKTCNTKNKKINNPKIKKKYKP
jgi:hypothetical protein